MVKPEVILREAVFNVTLSKILDEVASNKNISRAEATQCTEVQHTFRNCSEV